MTNSFSSLGVRADLAACLKGLGIVDPFPIQTATLPAGLAGTDLFAQSPTGSGKTLAFAIPLVTRIGKATARRPRALVLAPTRELAAQIAKATQPLARTVGRSVAAFYGGVGYKEQLSALQRGVDVVVGCPGRLIDLLDRRAIDLSEVEVVVIDEADRMADMGFLPAVRQLLDEIRVEHQTMLFSATRTKEVERLVRDYQTSPERHLVEHSAAELASRRHEFWRGTREERVAVTAQAIAGLGSSIVFCRTKHGADRLARQLATYGVRAVAIHGDRSQAQRERALAQFRAGAAQVLVGTDVASRGIHVDGVDGVIHFDPPADDDTYVHRSGRTGRAGASGLVISLVTSDQEKAARQLIGRLALDAVIAAPPNVGAPLERVPAVEPPSPSPSHRPPQVRSGQAAVPGRGRRRTNRSSYKGTGRPGASAATRAAGSTRARRAS